MRASEFTSALLLTASGATKRFDRLERAGLIRRKRDSTGRRAVRIALMAKGQRLLDEMAAEHLEAEERLLSVLSRAERGHLAGLLRKLDLSFVGQPPPQVVAVEASDMKADYAASRRPLIGLCEHHGFAPVPARIPAMP